MKNLIPKKDILALLICVISVLCFHGYSFAETITFNEYALRIREAIDYLEFPGKGVPSDMAPYLRKLFPPSLFVRVGEGETFAIDSQRIMILSVKSPFQEEDFKNLTIYLKALLGYVSFPKNIYKASSHWEESREILDEIYQTEEFKGLQEKKTPFWVKYLESIKKAILDWLDKNIEKIGHISFVMGYKLIYVIDGFILFLGGIIIFWIYRSFGGLGSKSKERTISSKAVESSEKLNWLTWRNKALEKVSAGEFREAIRSLFISVLMEGHVKGWWIYEPEATNREHLDRVEGPVYRVKALESLVGIYEKAWYGLGHPAKEEFRKCEKIVQLIEASS